jgi:hypothetical protein
LLSLEKLTAYQELFNPQAIFQLPAEIILAYRVSIPANVTAPRELDITNCLLSQRSSYVTNNIGENGYNICGTCNASIAQGVRPKFCIANNYCFGTPPECLTSLTEVERAAITPVKTFGYCFCYTGGQHLQLQGTLSYFKMDTQHIIQAMGNISATNANIIILITGKLTQQQYNRAILKNRISLQKINAAIDWLLQNNLEWQKYNHFDYRGYIESIRSMNAPKIIENCEIVNDTDVSIEGTETFFSFYPDGDFNTNTGGQDNIQSLQELVQDATINHRDIACRLNIIKEAVPDYKDNNFVNACILQFPYGRGGMHETRLKKMAMRRPSPLIYKNTLNI